MIKKVLIFVLLMVGGFFALNSMIEDTRAEADQQATDTASGKSRKPKRQGPGIRINSGKKGSTIRTDYHGPWNFAASREVKLESGEIRRVKSYQVKAKDSHTEPNNKLMLEDVTVDLYTTDTSNPLEPVARKSGTVVAGRARVEFSQGNDQAIRPAEDKLMEFWDVVYTATPSPSMAGLTVTMGHARVLNANQRLRLWTPDPFEPVEVVADGKRGFHITGKGFDAWGPAHRDARGRLRANESGTQHLYILHDPVLTERDTVMKARGQLHIEQHQGIAAVLVTMVDQVHVVHHRQTSQLKSGSTRDQPPSRVIAHGDSLRANLVRTQADGKEITRWTRIQLTGTPARLEDTEQIDLRSATITVLPDTEDEPYWFTAAGTGAHTPTMSFTQRGQVHTFKSSGRVHLIRTRKAHGLLLQGYGIPMAAIPRQFDSVLLFEGQTLVSSPADGMTLTASEGITVIRSEDPELRDTFLMQGRGLIDIVAVAPKTAPAITPGAKVKTPKPLPGNLHASGNNGFSLQQFPSDAGSKSVLLRQIQLGPDRLDPNHRYAVEYAAKPRAGTAGRRSRSDDIQVVGTGSCRIDLRGAVIERMALTSPAEDIVVTSNNRSSRLSQVGSVLAWFDADNQLDRFIGKGEDCRMRLQTKDGKVEGRATEIHQVEPDAYRLHGSLAELREAGRGILRGRTIHIRRLAAEDLQMLARRDAYLQIIDDPAEPRSGPRITADLHADEIRIEPFLLPPATAKIYQDLLPHTIGLGLDARHLFATGKVRFDYTIKNPNSGVIDRGECRGDALVIRTDRSGKLFSDGHVIGQPARFDSHEAEHRHTVARADVIRFFLRQGEQHLTLDRVGERLPSLQWVGDLRQQTDTSINATPTGPQATTRLTCAGPIVVAPRRITYQGAVRARSYDAQGQLDPTGLALDAGSMVIDRTAAGLVDRIRADINVVFGWSGARGTCDSLILDITQQTLSARGQTKPAVIQLPNTNLTANQVDYNYRTRLPTCWYGESKRALTAK